MSPSGSNVDIEVYPPDRQGTGGFDGGRITEIKPIGFPHEGSAVKRMGPLFYWAWATSKGYGKIGLHPHKGFEIMSYVLDGEIGHRDSLGIVSQVKTGGAQVMQTGSGVSHEEEFLAEPTDMMQIWFEPYLQEAVERPPTYREIQNKEFPVKFEKGVRSKKVLGNGSPVSLVADVTMDDITLDRGKTYVRTIGAGKSLAVVTIAGAGIWLGGQRGQGMLVKAKDFSVVQAREESTISIEADENEGIRLAIIEVPREVRYPLYGS
jgi:redox-sensitive bicupin YhaK (pirin superfamily)